MTRNAEESREELATLNRGQGISENDPFTEERYRQFARRIIGQQTVLDVGCNTGRGGAALKSACPSVRLFGLEMLPDRVAQIPPGLYEAPVTGEYLEDHHSPAGGYDVILMGELIEHVPWAGIDPLIFSAKRLLKPGGKIFLTTPNPHYLLLKRRSRGSVLGGPHVSVHCPEALSQYLKFRGFNVDELCGTGRVSATLGHRWPLSFYGAYLLVATTRP
ncbi:class I SAM-dependent methyltransferase [Williamsia sp.]|uniref:class I SAM-dependent methyltransferase n=1 Tax=Williamsia sp. TaxID=1872085 RepID=UPI001A1C5089|nr:class I SAM-dependent methyltransferase [Williamsia sp.]MBJ7289897.1 class I SAM-dependent methyltransferase [Williamsia sp.]